MENVITMGKLISVLLLFCLPSSLFCFLKPKIQEMSSLALYWELFFIRGSVSNTHELECLANEIQELRYGRFSSLSGTTTVTVSVEVSSYSPPMPSTAYQQTYLGLCKQPAWIESVLVYY